jgi:hypothetical protein
MAFMTNDSSSKPWRWVADGAAELPAFASQSDAETWLGEHFSDLLEDGISAVTLMENDRSVYGPMPLAPEDPLGG